MTPVRRVLCLLAMVGIVALRIEPQLMQLPFLDRKPFADYFASRADSLWPQYPRFLEGVRAHTGDGDSVALVVPTVVWDEGYSYAYYRASYFLAGREVLPVADSDGRLHPENLEAARYAAVWGRGLPSGRYTVVWRGAGGALLRK